MSEPVTREQALGMQRERLADLEAGQAEASAQYEEQISITRENIAELESEAEAEL